MSKKVTLVILLSMFAVGYLFAQSNLLVGGDFEEASVNTAWFDADNSAGELPAAVSVSADTAKEGTQALAIDAQSVAVKLRNAVAVEAGKLYRFSAWLKLDGQTEGSEGKVQLEAHWGPETPITNATRVVKPYKFGIVTSDTTWTLFALEMIAPEGASFAEFGIYSTSDGVLYVDDCQVVEKQEVTYFDSFEADVLDENWINFSEEGHGVPELTTDEAKTGEKSLKVIGNVDLPTVLRYNLVDIDSNATYTLSGWIMLDLQSEEFDGKAQIETHWGFDYDEAGQISSQVRRCKPKKLTLIENAGWTYFLIDVTPESRSDKNTDKPQATLVQVGVYVKTDGVGYFDDIMLTKTGSTPTSVQYQEISTPATFALKQNYPNPFNPSTTINYTLESISQVNLGVYNLSGQLVKSLVNGQMTAGVHSVNWDGRNENLLQVPSGTYLYQIKVVSGSGTYTETRKMLFLK